MQTKTKGLILIQGGKQTIVPDTAATRKFWQDYNTATTKSSISHKKYVTMLEADAEETARYLKPAPRVVSNAPMIDQKQILEQQAKEISELKSMLLRLTTGAPAVSPISAPIPEENFETFD